MNPRMYTTLRSLSEEQVQERLSCLYSFEVKPGSSIAFLAGEGVSLLIMLREMRRELRSHYGLLGWIALNLQAMISGTHTKFHS